jgi:hypothetical protein
MARIDWMLLCETAFLDRQDRVSLIGVATEFPVPSLPLVIKQMMMVARVVDARPGDEMRVGVAIGTPSGQWTQPRDDGFAVEQAGEYLLITLRDVPLLEAGLYQFALALGQQELVTEIPVVLPAAPQQFGVH